MVQQRNLEVRVMTCKDAPRLLRERREAAAKGDFDTMRKIDAERWAHDPDEETCCECWVNARRAAYRLRAA